MNVRKLRLPTFIIILQIKIFFINSTIILKNLSINKLWINKYLILSKFYTIFEK